MSVAVMPADCPGEELILDFADGRVSAAQQQRLEQHFDDCAACTSVLAALAHRTTIGRPRALARIRPGATFDRYLVRRQIGRGSMGVVFEAYDPELDRRVAIKVIRAPPDGVDEHDRARVLDEARALARLSHPNVVPVLTVGTRDDEIFVVMELVEGVTIRHWLAERTHSTAEIVARYIAAGHGLAAAHRAGVVHRDFKPDNVLVGEDGRVRVIDFGLARLLADEASRESSGESSSDSRERTGEALVVGTPAYMPPEQLLGGEVDERADQFALAASIYEALAGRRPWEATSLLRDDERATGARIPRRMLRALDTALSTRPEQRFPTVDAFVRALERASAGSGRRVAIAAAVGSLAIAAWLGVASMNEPCSIDVAAQWSDPEVRDAVRNAFANGPMHAAGSVATVERELDRRLAALDDARAHACAAEESDDPRAAAIRACIDVRRYELDAAVDLLRSGDDEVLVRSVDLVMRTRSAATCTNAEPSHDTDEEHAAMLGELARAELLGEVGVFAKAIAIVDDVLARATDADDAAVRARAAFVRGGIHEQTNEFDESIAWFETAYFGASDTDASAEVGLEAALMLGKVHTRIARFDEADRWLAHAEAMLGRHPSVRFAAALASARGRLLEKRGNMKEAVALFEQALALLEDYERETILLGNAIDDLGTAYLQVGRLDEALPLHTRTLEMRERLVGEHHPLCALVHNNIALDLMDMSFYDIAYDHHEWALAILLDAYGPDHLSTATEFGNLGALWGRDGEHALAATYFAASLPGYEASLGPDHPDVAMVVANLGYAYFELGDIGESLTLLERALEARTRAYGFDHAATRTTAAGVGLVREAAGDYERCVMMLEHALALDPLPGYDALHRGLLEDALARCKAHTAATSGPSPK